MDEDSSLKSCGRAVHEDGGREAIAGAWARGSHKLSPAAGRPGRSGLPSGRKAILCPSGR